MDKNKSNIFPHVTKYFKFYEIYTYKVFSFSIMFVIEYPKPVEYAYIYSGNWGGLTMGSLDSCLSFHI